MEIEHWDTAADGPLDEAALRRKLEARGYRVSRYVYPPGSRFPEHTHTADKMDAVLAGEFEMRMRGRTLVLRAGDCLAVPRDEVHSARVLGDQPVVSLDGVKVS